LPEPIAIEVIRRYEHLIGTFFSRLVPSPRGPRQPGQLSAKAASEKMRMSGIAKHNKTIIFRLMILLTPTVNAYCMLDESYRS
jgi:hypothetical protein